MSQRVRRAPVAPFVRGGFDLDRIQTIFAAALLPCVAMAIYNTGWQAARTVAAGATPLADGRADLLAALGIAITPDHAGACVALGAAYFLPILFACCAGAWAVERTTAHLRQRRTSGAWPLFGLLLALTLPPTTPLWQAALGAAFGILFGQEVFGGPGMTFINAVLLGRAFLFFAYPAEMSGDAPWIAASFADFDGFSGATPLARAMLPSESFAEVSWRDALLGFVPGSMGETSALACAIGATILLATRLASPWIIGGVALGTWAIATFFNQSAPDPGSMAGLPFHWHVVVGSWAFATVFLATDAASAPFTNLGRLVYGFAIGALAILIRVANAAFAEGMMLAILFMNVFSPLINFATMRLNILRRRRRRAA